MSRVGEGGPYERNGRGGDMWTGQDTGSGLTLNYSARLRADFTSARSKQN